MGTPHAAVPVLTEHFPGRPGAIEVGPAGLRYPFIEGIPPAPGRLEAGQEVRIGVARCAMPDDATLECHADGGSFTISGPDHAIATEGTVLDEQDYSNFPDAQSTTKSQTPQPSQQAPTQSEQPLDLMGATGLVGGVRTSAGRLVTASAPPCDGRGILILDSYVETLAPQQGIANLLDRYPGAEFAPPGQCPSLRANVETRRATYGVASKVKRSQSPVSWLQP